MRIFMALLLPCFTGIRQKPPLSEKKFIPHFVNGLHGMSMGFLLEKKHPFYGVGLCFKLLYDNFFQDVAWPPLDILFC
ncbi:MAG: P-loop NTPase [Holosporaceae bacterium]|nr:MAG: P-loop NTPase [Holosporaceae bacterium]